jgi:hypothetical protein
MRTHKRIVLGLVLSLLSMACVGYVGPEEPADNEGGLGGGGPATAQLTILGDTNLTVDNGAITTLNVKYTDLSGRPLAGAVEFRIQGDALGAALGAASSIANNDGVARVDLSAGPAGDASFTVIAAASDAQSIMWRITVGAGGGGQPLPVAAVPGVYLLDSQFDVVSGLPGTAGNIVNTVIGMTDSPADPASFLLDQIGGTAGNIIDGVRPFLDYYLNDRLLYYAPSFLSTFVAVGDDFGQVARRFGVVTELQVTAGAGGALIGRHTVKGVHWTIDGRKYEFSAEELGLGTIVAENVPLTYDGMGRLTMGDHSLGISYGTMLLFVLNQVIIPELQPGSYSIGAVLSRMVDCTDVGFDIADYLGLGIIEAYLLSEGCDEVMDHVGGEIEDLIRGIGGSNGTSLYIRGDGLVADTNGDLRVDSIRNGLWEGEIRLGSAAGPLTRPDQRFTGNLMTGVTGTP